MTFGSPAGENQKVTIQYQVEHQVHPPINEGIQHHEIPGLHFLPERAAAGRRQNVRHPELLHGANVGAVVDLGWVQAVLPPVAEREHYF